MCINLSLGLISPPKYVDHVDCGSLLGQVRLPDKTDQEPKICPTEARSVLSVYWPHCFQVRLLLRFVAIADPGGLFKAVDDENLDMGQIFLAMYGPAWTNRRVSSSHIFGCLTYLSWASGKHSSRRSSKPHKFQKVVACPLHGLKGRQPVHAWFCLPSLPQMKLSSTPQNHSVVLVVKAVNDTRLKVELCSELRSSSICTGNQARKRGALEDLVRPARTRWQRVISSS